MYDTARDALFSLDSSDQKDFPQRDWMPAARPWGSHMRCIQSSSDYCIDALGTELPPLSKRDRKYPGKGGVKTLTSPILGCLSGHEH